MSGDQYIENSASARVLPTESGELQEEMWDTQELAQIEFAHSLSSHREPQSTQLVQEHLVREIAVGLRGQVHKFINAGRAQPAELGFTASVSSALSVHDLQSSLHDAVERLEDLYNCAQPATVDGLNTRAFAQSLQTQVELFLNFASDTAPRGSIGQNAVSSFKENAIRFKGELADVIHAIDVHEVRAQVSEEQE